MKDPLDNFFTLHFTKLVILFIAIIFITIIFANVFSDDCKTQYYDGHKYIICNDNYGNKLFYHREHAIDCNKCKQFK